MKALVVLVMAGFALCSAPFVSVRAQTRGPVAPGIQPRTPVLVPQAPRPLSLDQAVALAERHFHARVVRADARSEGGHTLYLLRLLNESGRVWTVRVDAESGTFH